MAGDPYFEEHWETRLRRVSAETREIIADSRKVIAESREAIACADKTLLRPTMKIRYPLHSPGPRGKRGERAC